jgi:uncharacterized membrane protein YagU involved in acid resistance
MKSGQSIPNWVGGLIAAALIIVLVVFGMRMIGGEGPRDPKTYPKEAFQPPKYDFSSAGYTKDGKPVGPPAAR